MEKTSFDLKSIALGFLGGGWAMMLFVRHLVMQAYTGLDAAGNLTAFQLRGEILDDVALLPFLGLLFTTFFVGAMILAASLSNRIVKTNPAKKKS